MPSTLEGSYWLIPNRPGIILPGQQENLHC